MVLQSPLTIQPHPYIGDTTGRPLEKGLIFIGEAGKDPEFHQIPIFTDKAMTKPVLQPIRTKSGYISVNGDLSEIYANDQSYSVKILDSSNRKVLYKEYQMRDNVTEDVVSVLTAALDKSIADNRELTITTIDAAIDGVAIDANLVTDALINAQGGVSQKTLNTGVKCIADMLAIPFAYDGMRIYVKSYHAGYDAGGGYFIYDSGKSVINDGGLVVNGWVRQYDGKTIHASWFGIKYDGTDEKLAVNKLMLQSDGKTVRFDNNKTLITSEQITMTKNCVLNLNGCHVIGKHKVGKPVGQRDVIALEENSVVMNGTVELFYDSHNFPNDSGFGAVIGIGIMSNSSEHATSIILDRLTILSDGMSLNGLKLMGDITNVIVRNINFPDNDMLGIPIVTHWTGDSKDENGNPILTKHPKNIIIENINFGHMKPTEHPKILGYDALSLIFVSSSSNVKISNIYCKSTEHKQGVLTIYCGDYHGVYSDIAPFEQIISSGIEVSNIQVEYAKYRMVYMYGRGIYEQDFWTRGVINFKNISGVCDSTTNIYAAIYIRHTVGATFENLNIKGGANAIRLAEGCTGIEIKNSTIGGSSGTALYCYTTTDAISGITIDNVSATDQKSASPLIDIRTARNSVVKNCRVGSLTDSGAATTGIRIHETSINCKVLDNHVVGLTSGSTLTTGYELGLSASSDSVCSLFRGNTVNDDSTSLGKVAYYQRGMKYPIHEVKVQGSIKVRELMGGAPPTEFSWNRGDRMQTQYPAAGLHEGWLCTVSGTPGTWKKFGTIES